MKLVDVELTDSFGWLSVFSGLSSFSSRFGSPFLLSLSSHWGIGVDRFSKW